MRRRHPQRCRPRYGRPVCCQQSAGADAPSDAAAPGVPSRPRERRRVRRRQEAMPYIPGIGVLLVNLGTPDAAEPKAVRRYLKEFLSDPRVIEKDTLLWKFVLNGIILPLRLAAQGARLSEDLEPREERVAAQDHHPLASREARRHSRAARQARDRRLGDALCQSFDCFAARSARRARLRPHPGHAALSAICRGHHRDGLRRSVPLFAAAAPAAGDTHHAGLLRRSLLHRSAVVFAQG